MIGENIQRIQYLIEMAAARSGRQAESVQLIVVSKMVKIESILEALASGIHCLGENRVQEAQFKKSALTGLNYEYHLIGPLQTNKVKLAINTFDCIQTVDSLKLANRIDRLAELENKVVKILIQVNIGRELQKTGVMVDQLEEFVQQLLQLKHISVEGLMAIPPYFDDVESVRPYFRQMKSLFNTLNNRLQGGLKMDTLSMGMSNDFEIAIEEGATMVRVGSAIFGKRSII